MGRAVEQLKCAHQRVARPRKNFCNVAVAARRLASGNKAGAHAVAWERYANDYGDVDGQHSAGYRHSYPFGLMVNANGDRFVDEGADFRNYTYAKYGRAVLAQPGSYAWQVFDSQVLYLLRDEYKMRGATKVPNKGPAKAATGKPITTP